MGKQHDGCYRKQRRCGGWGVARYINDHLYHSGRLFGYYNSYGKYSAYRNSGCAACMCRRLHTAVGYCGRRYLDEQQYGCSYGKLRWAGVRINSRHVGDHLFVRIGLYEIGYGDH